MNTGYFVKCECGYEKMIFSGMGDLVDVVYSKLMKRIDAGKEPNFTKIKDFISKGAKIYNLKYKMCFCSECNNFQSVIDYIVSDGNKIIESENHCDFCESSKLIYIDDYNLENLRCPLCNKTLSKDNFQKMYHWS